MRNLKKITAIFFVTLFSFVFFGCKKESYFYIEFVVDGEVIQTVKSSGKAEITLPENPTSAMGVFDGWFLDKNVWSERIGGSSFIGFNLAEEKIKAYAKWKYYGEMIPTYERVYGDGNSDTRKYILFGEYPQTIIKPSGVMVNHDQIDARGYFLGSDGYYYAQIEEANPYENSSYFFSTGADIKYNRSYYFKVEPIKWRILSEEDGKLLLLCEDIITNKAFSSNNKNDYLKSSIRKWLNEDFYNIAFSAAQKSLLSTLIVSDETSEEGIVEDNIFLLSQEEAQKSDYDLSYIANRSKLTTDYSRATGIRIETDKTFYGEGIWWLRTSYEEDDYSVYNVDEGSVNKISAANKSSIGVAPALRIKLPS